MSWNLRPRPSAIPTNLAERNAELWASPQGFVKAALAHHAGAAQSRRTAVCGCEFTLVASIASKG